RVRLGEFLDRLERWRTQARRGSLAKLIWTVYQQTGFSSHVVGLPNGEQRLANLLALHDRACEFDRSERNGLSRFLRFIERMAESGEDLGMAPALSEAADVVRVMSIHASKGLEYPVVLVCGLGKAFNDRDLHGDVLFDSELGLGPKVADVANRLKYPSLSHLAAKERLRRAGLAEEIRLLYVAVTRAKERLILTGSLRQPEKTAARWCRAAECPDVALPADLLVAAASPLDFVGMALARHRDGQAIRQLGGHLGGLANPVIAADRSSWQICVHAERWGGPIPQTGADLPASFTIERPLPEILADLSARLSWQYPQRGATFVSAKVTVTEATKRTRQAMDPEAKLVGAAASKAALPVGRKPRFFHDSPSRPSAAERGRAVHLFLQHIDFAGPCDLSALRAQLADMIDRELLTAELAATIPLDPVIAFLGQPLGRRLRTTAPNALWRELPFSMYLPADQLLADAASAGGQPLLLQGVIDCLLVEPAGLTILDWKTDSPKGRSISEMAWPYRQQMELYCRAAATMFGKAVREAYLVFLATGEALSVLYP
ncbi:MAG: PD-(D/E)XK nuclease family protein, partial [Cyanobacteria bacterium REEB65]|nr:PD-(D/E)XK nuclease family protein [Cyanobacteria bacterium REEB65]